MKDTVFDENTVRALATVESFARGREYSRRGAVSGLVRRGERLIAEVDGSEFAPYAVTIEFRDGGVAATRCTCPYDWGGACKHIVAVLLKYREAPGAVAERPSLADMLGDLDREALMALLVKRAGQDPVLEPWLEAELLTSMPGVTGQPPAAIDSELVRRQAERVLSGGYSRRHGWDDDVGAIDEEAFSALIDRAKPFLDSGEGRHALKILEPVLEALVPAWREQADFDETLHEFFSPLGQMIAEAVLISDLLPEERDDLMARLDVWQGLLDDYGLDGYLQVAVDALDQGWDEIGLDDVLAGRSRSWPPSGRSDWTTERLTQARLQALDVSDRIDAFLNLASAAGRHGDYTAMLVRLGRIDEAVDHARKWFRSSEETLQLARLLKDTGYIDAALALAERGVSLTPENNRFAGATSLARWLRDNAGLLGRRELALMAARRAFDASLSLEDFEVAATLAGPDWIELRAGLLAGLAAAPHAWDRTKIYLSEGMIEEAVRSVDLKMSNPNDTVLMRLANVAQTSHPGWVVDIAERMASTIMEAGRSSQYELAAQWLEKAALAYKAAGRVEDWIAWLDSLIEKHRRKHKLRPLLQALRQDADTL
ncbi:SWIM zinc finger domain-containing protein [Agrobacterium rhizogenes]|uniref:SWIM zinc finger family protein n=1 Tax=Rhizobium rhizogenes TaxID=359 RepID=UPI001574384E|nr:SWIM zinc finger family protein [Rhizobium rhizogenes]NTF91418.1 SWIM zinc finger domain-containing protein [Rhizobium rhizogenes]